MSARKRLAFYLKKTGKISKNLVVSWGTSIIWGCLCMAYLKRMENTEVD